MYTQNYESLAAYILTVDKAMLGFLLPIDFFVAVAFVAILSRTRRPWELLAMLMGTWLALLVLTGFLFHWVFDRPFIRLEVVQYPYLMEWVRHIRWL